MIHVDIKDTMHPKNFIIDEKQCIVVIPIKIEKENRKTGKITMVDGVGTYKLVIDENDTMKIKSLDFFWHAPNKILQKYS